MQLTIPDGNNATWQFNANNQVVLQVDSTGAHKATTYTVLGQIATITDGLGRLKMFGYDANGQQTSERAINKMG